MSLKDIITKMINSSKTEEEEEESVLVCVAVTNDYSPVAGSSKITCATCFRWVWISPEAAAFRETTPNLRIICERCMAAELRANPDQFNLKMGLLPGSLEIIEAEHGAAAADMARKMSQMPMSEVFIEKEN